MIRPAKFFDTMRIVELMHEMHEASRYATVDQVDEKAAHRLISQCIHRHGHSHVGGACVMVHVRDQKVEGFMVGMLDHLYHIGKSLMAQDIFLFCSKKAKHGASLQLLRSYVDWAAANPKVKEIKLSWTDAISGAEQIENVYERMGFRRCGGIFERVNVEQELAA